MLAVKNTKKSEKIPRFLATTKIRSNKYWEIVIDGQTDDLKTHEKKVESNGK